MAINVSPLFLTLLLKRLSIIPLFLILISCSNPLNQKRVVIKDCYDGDTCTTTIGEKIRLACIDTPELRGKRADPTPAQKAKDYLNELIAGKEVVIKRKTKDRYKRTVAELYLDEVNVQEHLVKQGLAKVYEKYANQCVWTKSVERRLIKNDP